MTEEDVVPGRSMEADLTAQGRVITLETWGRRSGRPRPVTVGFVAEAGGSLLIAAADERSDWALNLMAEPACIVELSGARSGWRARRLEDDERGAAVSALILKYGTPAERLGGGPAFRLTACT